MKNKFKSADKDLGMGRNISRRDLLQGLGAVAASSMVPGKALADAVLAQEIVGEAPYPPALTGMRGNHPGSFEVAHKLAREGKTDWGGALEDDSDVYDLVVVGAGLSGLSSAYFYLAENPKAKVLILDNHDDFGGHAKRNEFQFGQRMVLGYGGSQTMEEPSTYSGLVKALLDDLAIDLKQFDTAYDNEFFQRHGLSAGTYFNKEAWGSDTLVDYDIGGLGGTLPVAPSRATAQQAVEKMPISEAARKQLLGLLTEENDLLSDIPLDEKEGYLYSITYKDFLTEHMGITEPDVFKVLQDLSTDASVGIDTATAGSSLLYIGLPGSAAAGVLSFDEDYEPYIHHYPDGNANIARRMVLRMIPAVAKGVKQDDILHAKLDYSQLDRKDWPVRLRLSSAVVNVAHEGPYRSAKTVRVSYVNNGKTRAVRAKHCVMACYNAMIPSICPELGKRQKKALAKQVKTPILYTNVALRNWQAWKKLGLGAVSCPGSYHVNAMMDFPVSMEGYQFSDSPDEPIVIHMERFPHRPNEGLSKREQHRLGRYELLSTPFETIERSIREQLTGILGEGGFDPARDIEAITVNRWAHGYSYSYDWTWEDYYDDWDDRRYPHVRGRQQRGRLAIANSDAGARATLDTAIEQGFRATMELLQS
ncbi:MAG: FAD/NAD(P)-binding protein [Pseudomonadota bacterium]